MLKQNTKCLNEYYTRIWKLSSQAGGSKRSDAERDTDIGLPARYYIEKIFTT